MDSLHDYNIFKYEVLSSERQIVFHTKDHHGDTEAIVTFSGVSGHLLEHGLEGNIVLDFDEYEDIDQFYSHFENGLKRYQKYGLPLKTENSDSFLFSMKSLCLKAYVLSTSYGLHGWILAKTVQVEYNKLIKEGT
ncbi:hypothetical protein [Thalassotalea fusca]